MTLGPHSSRKGPALLQAWPQLLGAGCCAIAAVLLFLESRLQTASDALVGQVATPPVGSFGESRPALRLESGELLRIPPLRAHLGDLNRLVETAPRAGMPLGRVSYRTHELPDLGLVIRTADLQSSADYPRVKQFLAILGRDVPHGFLEEIRFERKDPANPSTLVHMRWAFVYQAETPATTIGPR